jgi:2,4-dichlorophenol 6-monooxygenase
MFGLQLGFRYAAGALVPDGLDTPLAANPVRDFIPALRSGARLPHAWITRAGRRISTLDLIRPGELTLICARSAKPFATAPDLPLRVLVEGRDFSDTDGDWARLRGLGTAGAGHTTAAVRATEIVLVRPDQHVAWWTPAADDTPSLLNALAAVAGKTA